MVINFCAWSGLLTEGIDEKHIVSVLEALWKSLSNTGLLKHWKKT